MHCFSLMFALVVASVEVDCKTFVGFFTSSLPLPCCVSIAVGKRS
jgi:hypothetical protein